MTSRCDAVQSRPCASAGGDEELGLIRRAAGAAAAGAGAAVLVEGAAGLGKSFLLDAAVRAAGLPALRGRAWEEGGAPPYWPWREVATAGGWALPDGAPDPFALYAGVVAELRAHAADRPLLVVLDDLHAADDDTLRLTRYVARAISDVPVLLLAAARPSERLAGLDALRIELRPLDAAAAAEVVDLWAPESLDDAARRRVVEQAEGNPLHLRELARLPGAGPAADPGTGPGAGPATGPGAGLPEGLRATVLRRLAVLDAAARELLEAAAVLGRDVDVLELARVLDREPAALLPLLDAARAHGIVTPRGGTAWSFSHQLQRDAAYDALPAARRTALHARAAGALRSAGAGAAEVARHLLDAVPAVNPALAVAAARAAAAEAVAAGAPGEAAAVLDRALPLVPAADRLAALLALGDVQLDAGQVLAAHRTFDAAADAARRTGDAGALARAALGRTARLSSDSSAADQLPLLGEALGRAEAAGRNVDVVRLRARRSVVEWSLDRPAAARTDAETAVRLARGLADPGPLAEALAALHMACWEPGREEEAALVSRELVAVSERVGNDDRLLEALLARLVDALNATDPAAVDDALGAVVALAERTGRPRHRYFADSRLAMRAFLAGRLAEGDRLSERARRLGEQIEEPDAFQVYSGSRIFVLRDLVPAEELAEQAAGLDETLRVRFPDLRWFASLGWLAAGRADRALAVVRDGKAESGALANASALELSIRAQAVAAGGDQALARTLEPLLRQHAGRVLVNAGAVAFGGAVDHYLGLLRTCLGDTAQARADLLAARAVYERLGALHFLGRVDAALAALGDERAGGADPRVAVLRPAGDGWEAGFLGATVVLPDLRGLRHLSALLRAGGAEVPAAELAAPGSGALAAAEARDVVLDDAAKRAYRRRVTELQAALAEADDDEREAALRAELDALLAELRRAVGLGGRDRPLASATERARVAVRKAVTAAVDRVAEHDAAFAHLLRTTVRTGATCAYVPDPNLPIRWLL